MKRVRITTVAMENQLSTTYQMSVALVIRHAMHMRCIILSVASLALSCYSTLSHEWQNFRGKKIEYKICVLFSLQLLFETFLNQR